MFVAQQQDWVFDLIRIADQNCSQSHITGLKRSTGHR